MYFLGNLELVRAEEIVKFRRVVGSDWLEYIYNVYGLCCTFRIGRWSI